MGYEIEPAAVADAESLSVLATQVWLDTYAVRGVRADYATHVLREYAPGAFRAALAAEDTRLILCREGEFLLGYVRLLLAPEPRGEGCGTAEIGTLYVQPAQKGRGIGGALLDAALEVARQAGHDRVFLTAFAGNHAAAGFYLARGWRFWGDWTFHLEGEAVPNHVYCIDTGRG